MAAPINNEIRHTIGDTFIKEFFIGDANGVPIDLAGWIVKLHVRRSKQTSVKEIELSSLTSGITVNAPLGKITATVLPAQTIDIGFNDSSLTMVWDLELTSVGLQVITLVAGNYVLLRDVTRI
jgi:hypothetical protein